MIFADQFIHISTRLSSPLLYGLGEHTQPLLINITNEWRRLTFWTRDIGVRPDTNLYGKNLFQRMIIIKVFVLGVHPFHINLELNKTGQTSFHGQFMLNANAMDMNLQPLPALTYITIGGIVDLYVFTGPTVQNVIQQYWDVIGVRYDLSGNSMRLF